VESSRDVAAWLDSIVAYNRTRVREGVVAEADLIRAEVERDRVLAESAMQEADLARARAELDTFLGDSTGRDRATRVSYPSAPLRLPNASNMERPDVRSSRERLRASEAGIGLERSMLIRQLGATIGAKQMMGSTSMIAGVSLPIPFFDQNRGEVGRATAERDAALLELTASRRMAAGQLAGVGEAARILTERAAAMTARGDSGYLARAEQAKRITLGAYREGAVPLLQVLDAARAWNEARLAYYDLLFAQHQSALELLFASGVDLRSAAEQLDNPTVR
jgi:cobalt-zinc-cadmium efflux system outer membrane protein